MRTLGVLFLASAASLSAQCELIWAGSYGCPGVATAARASTLWDPDGPGPQGTQLVVGGFLQVAGRAACDKLAMWDPATRRWSALASPPGQVASALAVLPTGELVAATHPQQVPFAEPTDVYRFDGVSWLPMGGTFDERVAELVVSASGELYAAGAFAQVGGTAIGGIARWDGAQWQSLAGFAAPSVRALCADGGGGLWFGAGADVHRWNGTAVVPVGNAGVGPVQAVAVTPAGELFVGGSQGLARRVGAGFQSMALQYLTIVDPAVDRLALLSTGELLVSGRFSTAGGATSQNLAGWDTNTNTWIPYGQPFPYGLVGGIEELPGSGFALVGQLAEAGGIRLQGVAIFDGGAWRASHDAPPSANAVLALDDTDFVVGGWFATVGEQPFSYVTRWDGQGWNAMGAGLGYGTVSYQGGVSSFVRLPGGELLAAGLFDRSGATPLRSVARWDGAQWHDVDGGVLANGAAGAVVDTLSLSDGRVLCIGSFDTAGGVAADRLAAWTPGVGWSAFAPGAPTGTVLEAIERANGNLLLLTSGAVSEWDGATWTPLAAAGNQEQFQAMALQPDGVVVLAGIETQFGGQSTTAFVQPLSGFQRYYGRSGLSWVRSATTMPDGSVVVSGSFLEFEGQPAGNFVRVGMAPPFSMPSFDLGFDGGIVADVDTFPNGDLLLAGGFLGRGANWTVARISTTCPASATAFGGGCQGSGGLERLEAVTLPWIGSDFVARASNLPANGLAVAAFGFATAALPLPNVLPQAGPGCVLWTAPDVLQLLVPNSGGAEVRWAVPNDTGVVGVVVHQQVVSFELGAAGIQQVATGNRLTATIGAL